MLATRPFRHALAILLAAAAPALACTGDCNGDGEVTINEAITGVNVALGNAPVGECTRFDANQDGSVTVNELIAAVGAVLDGCPEPTPGPTPDPDSPATLTIVTGNGQEFITGRSYGFDLADFRGNQQIAFYEGLLAEDHPDTLAEVRLTQTILDAAGNPLRDSMGRRRIVSFRFDHFPLQTGTFHCGEGLPSSPGSLLTFDAIVSLRDDALLQETILDNYFGYPRVTDAVDCTLTITAIDDTIVATFESHMLNADVDDLAHATGTLRIPKPTCTYPQLQQTPRDCYPWAF